MICSKRPGQEGANVNVSAEPSWIEVRSLNEVDLGPRSDSSSDPMDTVTRYCDKRNMAKI